jgi:hypothetical protein
MPNDSDLRRIRIVAQDPSVKQMIASRAGGILTAHVEVPAEPLRAGPWGYRVQVIDYDASSRIFFKPFARIGALASDRYENASDAVILEDPRFHCQNVYALVMSTLALFERALGRRLRWGFGSHHLIVLPHAFRGANAYYSPQDHALLFGYFTGATGKKVYTCLSHDVIVHETTHALLHGLRERFNDPSSPDQAAFHEGFADVVALLSVFSLREVAAVILGYTSPPSQSKCSRLWADITEVSQRPDVADFRPSGTCSRIGSGTRQCPRGFFTPLSKTEAISTLLRRITRIPAATPAR